MAFAYFIYSLSYYKPFSHYAPYFFPNGPTHFPILCTMQYNFHCISTFSLPRSVNRSIPLQYVMSENTGSIICCRREYNSRYAGLSIFSLIFSDRFSLYFFSAIYNVRACLFAFLFFTLIHFSISGRFPQSPAAAWYFSPSLFLSLTFPL